MSVFLSLAFADNENDVDDNCAINVVVDDELPRTDGVVASSVTTEIEVVVCVNNERLASDHKN